MTPTEGEIQKSILEYLELLGIFHYRNNTGAFRTERGGFYRFGKPGSPDIIAVIGGRYIGIEVKRPGENLSPAQEAFRDNLEAAGGRYVMAQSLDDIIGICSTT